MAIANKGKANREVVQGLINDMRTFNDIVSNELKMMKQKADDLGNSWKDSQYNQFYNFVTQLNDSINKDLEVLKESADDLQRRLNIE